MPRLAPFLLLLLCASCAPAASAPQYSADDMRRYADATEHVQATQAERAYQKTQEHLATLDTLAVAQTQQAAQLRSDAATATVAAQQARETATATAAIATAVQAEHRRETQQAIAFGIATQGAIATDAHEQRQRQDAATVAEAWRLGQQALIIILCSFFALLAFSAYQFTATGREMYAEAQRAKIELTWADVRRKEVDVERLKVQVIAGAVIYHDAGGPRVIEAARATASASPAQYQDLPLAGDEPPEDGPQAEAVKFLKLCIDWQSANKRDYRMIPSAAQLGMHPEERARYRRLFGEAIIMRPGVGTYVADGTLYDLLRRVGSGDLELVTA